MNISSKKQRTYTAIVAFKELVVGLTEKYGVNALYSRSRH